MSATPSTTMTLLKFRSSSLINNTLYDAHTGALVFELIGGYTYPTIAVDHGGFIGIKNTCVVRPTTFVLDAEGAKVAYVQWRGDAAVNVWIHGRNIAVPCLCSEQGEVMSAEDLQSVSGKSMGGVSEEIVLFPWTLKGGVEGTWGGDEENAMLVNASGHPIAVYAPATGAKGQGEMGYGSLKLDAAAGEVIEVVATFLAMEGARRKVFDLGPLDVAVPPSPKSAKRRSLLKALKAYLQGVSSSKSSPQSSGSSGSSWLSSSRTSRSSE